MAEAEQARIAAHAPRGYLPIEGIAAYDNAVQKLLFGNDAALIAEGRVVTTRALGGTGALKVGADFLASAARCRCRDQQPELGKPPRAVRIGRLPGTELPLLRCHQPRHRPRRPAAGPQ